jgi:Gas vesicle synthesis protein GvpL/GvpF
MQPLGSAAPAAELPAPVATTGREYLEGKLRNGQRIEREVSTLYEPLAALAVEATRQRARGADELLRASYLIEAAMLARFRGTVERLQRTHPGVAILCTGPWPPYSFVAPTAMLTSPLLSGGTP